VDFGTVGRMHGGRLGAVTDELVYRLRAVGCVFAEDEAALLRAGATSPDELESMTARRVAGEPLEHVLGWVALNGVRLAVGPGVFVPRQRTRVLVAAVLDLIADRAAPVVVELCCGVAPVASLVARSRADATVWASDIDPAAVALAERNLDPSHVAVGDLFAGLPQELREHVDVVVANAPYVPTAELALMPVEAREHEPRHALDGGGDGLDLHRRIAAEVNDWLKPGGAVVIETSRRQAPVTTAALAAAGLAATIRRDKEIDGTAVVGVREG